jgi:hypothetical protein
MAKNVFIFLSSFLNIFPILQIIFLLILNLQKVYALSTYHGNVNKIFIKVI